MEGRDMQGGIAGTGNEGHFCNRSPYLETEPRPDLILQHFSDGTIEVRQNLHRKLRINSSFHDKVVESVRQRSTDTANWDILY